MNRQLGPEAARPVRAGGDLRGDGRRRATPRTPGLDQRPATHTDPAAAPMSDYSLLLLEPIMACSPVRCVKVFTRAGYQCGPLLTHGPTGFKFEFTTRGLRGSVIASQGMWDDTEWLHASIATTDQLPTYNDLVTLKQAVFGPHRTAYQVFASADRHVNIHPYALHLWGRADGRLALPDFGKWGTI